MSFRGARHAPEGKQTSNKCNILKKTKNPAAFWRQCVETAQHVWVRACLCEQRHQSNFGRPHLGHSQRQQLLQPCCPCLVQAEHKGQLKNRAKAIRVPSTRTGRVLPHAFTHTADLRHVQVEAGIHTIGEAACQHCNRLQIVQLPNTVVCLQDGTFRRNMYSALS